MGDKAIESYEDAAVASQREYKLGNFEESAMYMRVAQEFVAGKYLVKQMGDGALQLVPLEE